jgi:hypothetical protein
MKSVLRFAAVVVFLFTLGSIPLRNARGDEEPGYHFKVSNTTKETITKLLVSENGKKYIPFDVGRKGIPPDKNMELVWDEKTETSACDWFIKAVFADDSETPAKKFDFCQKNLEIEF